MNKRTHKDLVVWRKAISLAGHVYAATATFPRGDHHPLAGQMRRAAISIASNIAEGAGRGTRAEYLRFLNISRGSLAELETQICIGLELHLIQTDSGLAENVAEVGRLLSALIRKLKERRELAESFQSAVR